MTRVAIRMPNLGAEATTGNVVAWLRAVGEVVAVGDVIAELETEKATVEFEAPVGGRIVEIAQPAGVDVKVGDVLAILEVDG